MEEPIEQWCLEYTTTGLVAKSRLGKGATFIVELPIVTQEKQPGAVINSHGGSLTKED